MSFESYVDAPTLEVIDQAMRNAFATGRDLGEAIILSLERDVDDDGTVETIIVTNVLMTLAQREPARVQGPASTYMGADGQFEHETPFNIQKGDRGRLPANNWGEKGQSFVVTMVLPDEFGVTTALFTLQG